MLHRSRQLYHLAEDIDESENLIEQKPEVAEALEKKLRKVVARGTSREGPAQKNDTNVVIDVTQTLRWGEPLEESGE